MDNSSHLQSELNSYFPSPTKPLKSFALTAPISLLSFFIVYQLLENFTFCRRQKKQRSSLRTHSYSFSSLSCRLCGCSKCASFEAFT